jgi:hypothetical protein
LTSEDVVAGSTCDVVPACSTEDGIVAATTGEAVVASFAKDNVVATQAEDAIITTGTLEPVVVGGAEAIFVDLALLIYGQCGRDRQKNHERHGGDQKRNTSHALTLSLESHILT